MNAQQCIQMLGPVVFPCMSLLTCCCCPDLCHYVCAQEEEGNKTEQGVVKVQDGEFTWDEAAEKSTLTGINIEAKPGSLTMIVRLGLDLVCTAACCGPHGDEMLLYAVLQGILGICCTACALQLALQHS